MNTITTPHPQSSKTPITRPQINMGICTVDRGHMGALLAIVCGIFVATCISVSHGTTNLTFWDVVQGFLGAELADDKMFAIFENRMPRIVIAIMAGFMVAVVGGLLQSLAQNPLADPGILGLSQGSILAIMLVIVFYPNAPAYAYPLSGMAGAMLVGVVLLLLVGKHNQGGMVVLLMGIAVETTLSSISTVLIVHTPLDLSQRLQQWAMGSLVYSSWQTAGHMAVWFALCMGVVATLGRRLRAYDLGDQIAVSLGENIRVSKPVLVMSSVVITAYTVSAVGPLTFLGMLAPNLADFLSRASGAMRLVLAGAMGALILVIADFITRLLTLYLYVPVGLTLVLVGVPLFVLTLRLRHGLKR